MVSLDDSQFGFVPGKGTTDKNICNLATAGRMPIRKQAAYMTSLDVGETFQSLPGAEEAMLS